MNLFKKLYRFLFGPKLITGSGLYQIPSNVKCVSIRAEGGTGGTAANGSVGGKGGIVIRNGNKILVLDGKDRSNK